MNGVTKDTLRYTYDNNGNITAIRNGPGTEYYAKYTYDGLNQLIREDNAVLGKSWVFAYDTAGNILSKKEYAYTTGTLGAVLDTKTYTYATTGWKDRLTSFNGEGIAYDALGNPTTYRGHALTWGKIRQLESYRVDSNTLLTFAYDASGLRTRKGATTYQLDGSKILSETRPTGTIWYYYDNGGICGFQYNGAKYYYEKNLQGDITAIYDGNGNKKAEYVYDAWGNHTIVTDVDGIGTLNPFRYRGYYYDTETGLYYLNSRYYDPQTGRFINADDINNLGVCSDLDDKNLYAYCDNSPVDREDDGEFWHILAGAVAGALVSGAVTAITNIATGKKWSDGVGVAMASGALSGALASTGLGAVAQSVGNALISGAESFVSQGIEKGFNNIDYGEVVKDSVIGGITGASGGLSKGTSKHLTTQGKSLSKHIGKGATNKSIKAGAREIKKAASYYWKQTKNIFYKPLLKNSLKDVFKSSGKTIAKHYGNEILEEVLS